MTEHDPRLIGRLNRIEGQVRGIARMVEDGRYCIDILTQLRAVTAALGRVESALLREHLERCVEGSLSSDDRTERKGKIEELIRLLDRAR